MPRLTDARFALRLGVTAELGDWIHALAWAPDSSAVAVACADGAVATLDAAGGRAREHHRHDAPATTVGWSKDGVLASGGQDGRVVIGARVGESQRDWVERVAWRPDGQLLAVAHGRAVRLHDCAGEHVATSRDFPATVTCLGWHPRGVEVAAGSYGGVRLLRGRDGGSASALSWKGSVLALALSPDGKRLAHGNQDSSVHFWELRKGTELEMWGYETKVRELAWRPDGRYLATGGGKTVTVWDFAGRGPSGTRPLELDEHTEQLSWLAFRPGSAVLASAAQDGMAMLWHPGATDEPLAVVGVDDRITTAAWSPDGKRLALGGAGGTLAIVEVEERSAA